MVQNKRKAPASRKRRSWTIPKLLLIIGYGVVFAFLGIIFLMRQELFRVGIFGDKPAVRAPVPAPAPPRVTTEPQRSAPVSPPRVAKEVQRQTPTSSPPTSPAAQPPGEITKEEKKALDDILRAKR